MSTRAERLAARMALSTTLDPAVAVAGILAPAPEPATETRPLRPPTERRPSIGADLSAALPGWATARAIVLAALALGHFLVTNLHVRDDAVASQLHQGLLAWDGGFYRGIAQHGYGFGQQPHEALRFFPLFPLAGRFLGVVFAGRADIALLLIANASALLLGAAVHRLVIVEKGDEALARRAAWLIALVPPAFVLVLGYSEATFMLLAVGMFLAMRTGRWWWAAGLGVLAGLTRPVGVILAVPAAIEAGRSLRDLARSGRVSWRPAASRLATVASAPLGTAVFLGWVWARYGDVLLPLHVQQDARRRGRVVDPFTALLHEGRGILHGQHVGSGLHVPWALALGVLVVVCFRRWPASYGAFAGLMLLAALSSRNLDSLERYALSAFPFVLTGASLLASERLTRMTFVLGAASMEGYSLLAFLNAVVP